MGGGCVSNGRVPPIGLCTCSYPHGEARKPAQESREDAPGWAARETYRLRRVGKNKECRLSWDTSPRTRTVRPKHFTTSRPQEAHEVAVSRKTAPLFMGFREMGVSERS